MVTLSEFIQHLAWSGGVMLVAVLAAAYVRYRHDVGHRTFRRISLWFGVSIAVVMTLSGTANVTEARCTRDPSQFCRYNDNIPFIATVVLVYVMITLGRAFFMHFNR